MNATIRRRLLQPGDYGPTALWPIPPAPERRTHITLPIWQFRVGYISMIVGGLALMAAGLLLPR